MTIIMSATLEFATWLSDPTHLATALHQDRPGIGDIGADRLYPARRSFRYPYAGEYTRKPHRSRLGPPVRQLAAGDHSEPRQPFLLRSHGAAAVFSVLGTEGLHVPPCDHSAPGTASLRPGCRALRAAIGCDRGLDRVLSPAPADRGHPRKCSALPPGSLVFGGAATGSGLPFDPHALAARIWHGDGVTLAIEEETGVMNKSTIVLVAGVGLALAFGVATWLYRGVEADRIEAIATAVDSPLERPHSRSKGPADAKVVIVEFFDPACETCRSFDPFVKNLLAENPGRVRLVLRYAPFHAGSEEVVKALEAAGQQGRYWETLEVLYKTQPLWASHHDPRPEAIWQFLPNAGVDVDQARRDAADPKMEEIVQQDLADGRSLGVRKTPGFFVNGKPLVRFGSAQLRSLVETEIAEQYPQ